MPVTCERARTVRTAVLGQDSIGQDDFLRGDRWDGDEGLNHGSMGSDTRPAANGPCWARGHGSCRCCGRDGTTATIKKNET